MLSIKKNFAPRSSRVSCYSLLKFPTPVFQDSEVDKQTARDTMASAKEDRNSDEKETVKQSVKSLKDSYEHRERTNSMLKREQYSKMSATEKLEKKVPKQVPTEQPLTQTDSVTKQKKPEESTDLKIRGETEAGKSTMNVERENKCVVSHETSAGDLKDTFSGIPEEKENNEEASYENGGITNIDQKEDEHLKMSETEQCEQKKQLQELQTEKTPEESTDLMTEGETGAGKSTTCVKSVITHEANTIRTVDNKEQKKNDDEETVECSGKLLKRSLSVNTLKRTFENRGQTNSVRTQDKFCKTSDIEKKLQAHIEHDSTQIVSVSTKHRDEIKLNEDRRTRAQHKNQKMESTDLRIVMVGKTGAGKSSTGNTILRKNMFEAYLSTESLTEKCQKHEQRVEGRNILVIDTPGLFDTHTSEEELKNEIEKGIEMSTPGPHAFLLNIRLDVKFTDEEKNSVKWIERNFGEDALQYAIVLFTRGDQLDIPIEKFLKQNHKLRKTVVDCKGGYHVFNNRDPENRSQVSELLEKIDRMLKSNGGDHYNYEIYEEAQRRNNDEENKEREAKKRQMLEEEEKIRKDEKMRILNAVKNVLFIVAGLAGAVFGGVTLGDGGGGGTRAALITAAVAIGAGVLAGFIPSAVIVAGAVVMGGAAMISAEWAMPLLTPLIEKGAEVVISKMHNTERRKSKA